MRIYFEIIPSGNQQDVAIASLFCQKWRYKIMWQLRDLQDEIDADEENGVILVSRQEGFIIEVRGFSDKLRDKIYQKLTPHIRAKEAQSEQFQVPTLTDKILSEAKL